MVVVAAAKGKKRSSPLGVVVGGRGARGHRGSWTCLDFVISVLPVLVGSLAVLRNADESSSCLIAVDVATGGRS